MIEITGIYDTDTIYVVGHYCINYWQIQPLEELDATCDEFDISSEQIQQVKDALADPKNIWGDDEDWCKCAKHEAEEVRMAVAAQGKELDTLINDAAFRVRIEVAKRGYGLETLVNDEHWAVRMYVAKHGYRLDRLVKDEDYRVRTEVAKHGYSLATLVNDKNAYVRIMVAEQGYDLERLAKDEDPTVRYFALEKIREFKGE